MHSISGMKKAKHKPTSKCEEQCVRTDLLTKMLRFPGNCKDFLAILAVRTAVALDTGEAE